MKLHPHRADSSDDPARISSYTSSLRANSQRQSQRHRKLPAHLVVCLVTEDTCGQTVLTSEQPLIDLRDRPSPDMLRVLAISSPEAVNSFVMTLFQYGYARPNEWSRQLPTVNPGEVMRILTKRVSFSA